MYQGSGAQRFAPMLWVLTGIFTFRVIAQFLLLAGDIPGLPSFEQWHSGKIPYPYLLLSQLAILWVFTAQSIKFSRGEVHPHKRLGRIFFLIGIVYFTSVLLRFLMGITVMTESRWFTVHIPLFFHLILASFILLVAAFHQQQKLFFLRKVNRIILTLLRWGIYPLIMTMGILAHYVMVYLWHIDLLLGTYVPVVASGLVITLLEIGLPHKIEWHPKKVDVRNDILYMTLVQVLLPKLMVPVFVFFIVSPLQSFSMFPETLWPHDLPLWLQLILMILIADFFRYWLHRVAHTNPYLWRLHAVHHSSEKLYWFNVAKFHPVEKGIQMIFDVLPFIILGVNEHVISLYFVFYSINGFFQHCNIRLEFGWLNYLISSAHLHRWHHSKIPEESNANYGNNLIVWDLLFGTYYLPKNRKINDLGLAESHYPMDFFSQLKVPFKHS